LQLSNNYSESFKHFTPALAKATQLVFERGEGPYLYTVDGKKYLDYVSGIAVNSLGHCHPKIVAAIKNQAEKLIHGSFNLGYYPTAVDFAAKLAKHTPGDLDMFFFSNSGAEAVEGTLKLARYKTKRVAYLGFRGSFHGRTYGALSMTSSTVGFRVGYEPLLPAVYHASYPYCYRCPYKQQEETCSLECLGEIETMFKHTVHPSSVALVLFEPVQGEGGYIVPPQKYVKALAELCKDNDILLAFDEIQTGFGRTGHMFAANHFGITPDIMSLGKAIAGGMPLSAVASRKELMGDWPPGAHGGTFGANPVSCAAALASLEVYEEEDILGNCVTVGAYFKEKLLELQGRFPCIGDVRGLGLMLAVEIVNSKGEPDAEATSAINKYCQENGLLFFTCGSYKNCVRFITPLNIPTSVVDEGLTIFESALQEVNK
jgi:4-aminobutyrate aminotransferase